MPWPFLSRRTFDVYFGIGVLVQFLVLLSSIITIAICRNEPLFTLKPGRMNSFEAIPGWTGISLFLWIENAYYDSPRLYYWVVFHFPHSIVLVSLTIILWAGRSKRLLRIVLLAGIYCVVSILVNQLVLPQIDYKSVFSFLTETLPFIHIALLAVLFAWAIKKKHVSPRMAIIVLILFTLANYLAGYFGPYEVYYRSIHPEFIWVD